MILTHRNIEINCRHSFITLNLYNLFAVCCYRHTQTRLVANSIMEGKKKHGYVLCLLVLLEALHRVFVFVDLHPFIDVTK
jgi:hypothetical protein